MRESCTGGQSNFTTIYGLYFAARKQHPGFAVPTSRKQKVFLYTTLLHILLTQRHSYELMKRNHENMEQNTQTAQFLSTRALITVTKLAYGAFEIYQQRIII